MQVISENINVSTGILYWCQVDIEPFHIKLMIMGITHCIMIALCAGKHLDSFHRSCSNLKLKFLMINQYMY